MTFRMFAARFSQKLEHEKQKQGEVRCIPGESRSFKFAYIEVPLRMVSVVIWVGDHAMEGASFGSWLAGKNLLATEGDRGA